MSPHASVCVRRARCDALKSQQEFYQRGLVGERRCIEIPENFKRDIICIDSSLANQNPLKVAVNPKKSIST